jgi:hypothetical protein
VLIFFIFFSLKIHWIKRNAPAYQNSYNGGGGDGYDGNFNLPPKE